jgi:hypothetical protein
MKMRVAIKLISIFIFLMVLSNSVTAQIQDINSLYFIQITDTHVGQNIDRISKIIAEIKNLPYKIDFTVYTGDLFDFPLSDSLLNARYEILNDLPMPVYFIEGDDDICHDKFHQFLIHKIGKINYVKEHKGILLLFVSSFEPTKNSQQEALKWSEKILSENIDKSVLFFHHEPFMSYFYKDEELKAWKDLIKKYNILGLFSGHLHKDALIWHHDIPEFVAPCVVDFKGRQASYRLYECKNGKISYSSFYIQ